MYRNRESTDRRTCPALAGSAGAGVDQTDVPDYEVNNVSSDDNGFVTLHLASEALNGTYPLSLSAPFRNHLDTLHSDYAFVVAKDLVKSLRPIELTDTATVRSDWDFALFPNPSRGEVQLHLPEGDSKGIVILDLAGRIVNSWSGVSGRVQFLQLANLAQGSYWIRVSDGQCVKTKKLLIH